MYTIFQDQTPEAVSAAPRQPLEENRDYGPVSGSRKFEAGEKEDRMELYCRLTQILRQCGVPANLCGYEYIREAVLLDYFSSGYRHAVTKALYPEVAAAFSSTPSRVERGIRHAIEVTWTRGDWQALQKFFGSSLSETRGKPTNSEFIATISDYLRVNAPRR